MVNPSKEQLQLFNQHFIVKKIFAKLTIYELDFLRDYYFEYETTKSLEHKYHESMYGDYILDNREIIYHKQTEQKIKEIKDIKDIAQFIVEEMEPWLKTHDQPLAD